ncbi:MAG: pterin-binding protein [Chloroflexi bacterium B3_Chlor]|nr:MAG: pterin-binding protein [Chloroflexi bacterium B3_Chlor]
METVLRSAKGTVIIGPERPTVLIGERINPTGRKRLAAALKSNDLSLVRKEAIAQVRAGADVLDINVGVKGIDEVDLLSGAVRLVMEKVDVPLAIDTADVHALARALEVYRDLAPQGKPLVNSVNGEEKRLAEVLPLVKEHGAAVIGLCMGDEGVPSTVEKRVKIARKIVEQAEALDIPPTDVVIDCLAMAVAADQMAGRVTLETIHRVQEELGVNMTLGTSNASFGLPERQTIDQAFLAMAIQAGVNCPIVDVAKVRAAVLATDLLLGRDDYAERYIQAYRERARDR